VNFFTQYFRKRISHSLYQCFLVQKDSFMRQSSRSSSTCRMESSGHQRSNSNAPFDKPLSNIQLPSRKTRLYSWTISPCHPSLPRDSCRLSYQIFVGGNQSFSLNHFSLPQPPTPEHDIQTQRKQDGYLLYDLQEARGQVLRGMQGNSSSAI